MHNRSVLGAFATLFVMSTAGAAHAEAPVQQAMPTAEGHQFYLGALTGVDTSAIWANLDGGIRLSERLLPGTDVFVHGQVGLGLFPAMQARLGIEARDSGSGWLHWFGGVDAGYRKTRESDCGPDCFGYDSSWTDYHGALVAPRGGFELGDRLRLRLALEAPVHVRQDGAQIGFGGFAGITWSI
jgi:hypothetical protein